MFVNEAEVQQLTPWLAKQLKTLSDADTELMSEYVITVLSGIDDNAPVEEAKQTCTAQLGDFLGDKTEPFVNELFGVLQSKAYNGGSAPAAALAPRDLSAIAPAFVPAAAQADVPMTAAPPTGPAAGTRKRSFGATDSTANNFTGARNFKAPRQSGPGVSAGMMPPLPMPEFISGMPNMPGMWPPNPEALAQAMQMMQNGGFPCIPPFPGMGGPQGGRKRGMCHDYQRKGYCMRGDTCPYDHGMDAVSLGKKDEEYDPSANFGFAGVARGGRGGARGGRAGAMTGRTEFRRGEQEDKTITTLVVDNVPEDKHDVESIKEYFSQFGTVEEVNLEGRKRASIKFPDWDTAKKAWSDPAPIFNNRFVKVYWKKSENESTDGRPPKPEEPPIDMEEVKRKAAEAQRLFEERKAKKAEMEQRRLELEKQKEAFLTKQSAEQRALMERIKVAGAHASAATAEGTEADEDEMAIETERKPESQSEALKAQLAALQAEAEALGVSVEDAPEGSYRGRGRGRGRGGSYRGGFDPSFRGRGRGRGRGGFVGGGSMKLDNRTKKVAIGNLSGDKEEALREYLFTVGEYENVEKDNTGKQVVTFKDRRTAEKFMAVASKEIPNVGSVELTWVAPPPRPAIGMPNAFSTTPSAVQTPPPEEFPDMDARMDGDERMYYDEDEQMA
ncbi:hypothetical protein YB2330_001543 [Saitoella coloradoensis]